MNKHPFEVRAHELSHLMTEPKAKTSTKIHEFLNVKGESVKIKVTDESTKTKDILSEGAKTHIETMARRYVYKYKSCINSKYLDKGKMTEDHVIALYNEVKFCNLTKNTERITIEISPNCFLSGEWDCEIKSQKKIVDTKSCWSIETFPETKKIGIKDAIKDGYDWQGRAYMLLKDYDLFEVAYGIVDTPECIMERFSLDEVEMHTVSHIDPVLRLTTIEFKRDKSLDEKIKEKIKHAAVYFNEVVEMIKADHLS